LPPHPHESKDGPGAIRGRLTLGACGDPAGVDHGGARIGYGSVAGLWRSGLAPSVNLDCSVATVVPVAEPCRPAYDKVVSSEDFNRGFSTGIPGANPDQ